MKTKCLMRLQYDNILIMGNGEIMAKKQKEQSKRSWLSYLLLAMIPLILSVTIIYIVLSLLGMEPVKNTTAFLNRLPGVNRLITTDDDIRFERMEADYLAQVGDYQSELNRLMSEATEKDSEIEALEQKIVDLNNQLAEYQSQIIDQTEQTNQLEDIVKTYTEMRPKNAAGILTETTTEIAVDILKALPSDNRSEILANMEPLKAAELTELLVNN